MPKRLIIGISIAMVLVGAVVLAVLFVRSRTLTDGTVPGGVTDGTGSTDGLGGSGPPIQTVPQAGPCGDGVCSAGESWCKPDCGSAEDRFLGSISAMDVTDTSFKIAWKTDVPSTGDVSYGLTDRYELGTAASSVPAGEHAVQIGGLSPGTNYFVRVRATEEGGLTREAAQLIFETSASAR